MLVSLAGTNGSGKSTAARALLKAATTVEPVYVEKYKKPVGSVLTVNDGWVSHLVGFYGDAATGGCDAFSDVPWLYDRIEQLQLADAYRAVVFEGIRMMNHTRGIEMARRVGPKNVTVLLLKTSIEESLAGIRARREAAGREAAITEEKHIRANHVRAKNYASKMGFAGCRFVAVTRESAPDVLLELVGAK